MKTLLLTVLVLVSCTAHAKDVSTTEWVPSKTYNDGAPIAEHLGYQLWCKDTPSYNPGQYISIPNPDTASYVISDIVTNLPVYGEIKCVMKTGGIDGVTKWGPNSNEVVFTFLNGKATAPDPNRFPDPVSMIVK